MTGNKRWMDRGQTSEAPEPNMAHLDVSAVATCVGTRDCAASTTTSTSTQIALGGAIVCLAGGLR